MHSVWVFHGDRNVSLYTPSPGATTWCTRRANLCDKEHRCRGYRRGWRVWSKNDFQTQSPLPITFIVLWTISNGRWQTRVVQRSTQFLNWIHKVHWAQFEPTALHTFMYTKQTRIERVNVSKMLAALLEKKPRSTTDVKNFKNILRANNV